MSIMAAIVHHPAGHLHHSAAVTSTVILYSFVHERPFLRCTDVVRVDVDMKVVENTAMMCECKQMRFTRAKRNHQSQ